VLAECQRVNLAAIPKRVAAGSPEMLVTTYKAVRCHKPLDCSVNNSVCKILALFLVLSSVKHDFEVLDYHQLESILTMIL
jgi:hypothetical protein